MNVVVLDKANFPRDKVCAGWITPQVIDTLQIDTDDYRRSRVLQPIEAFIAGVDTQSSVTVSYDRVVSYGIRRCEFDDYLLRRSGARLRLGEAFANMERQGTNWIINGSLSAGIVVGAGGHFCPVARSLGANVGRGEHAITAQEIEFEMDDSQASACRVEPSRPELYFCGDLKGYAWCFRKGNFLNVGLGREDNHGLADRLKEFWDWLAAQGKVPAAKEPRFKGHAYLLSTRSPRNIVSDGVILVGDSVGLAYPQSGEGILPAIESGIMAAEAIVASGGNYAAQRLASYPLRLQERFGARQLTPPEVSPSVIRTTVARALLKTHWFTQHVVLDRWFLHSKQRPLLAQ
jgi:flavin-dependent dehydrogenase